jgi:Ion channel
VVTVTLQGLTLLAALRASQVSRRTLRVAALVAAVALVASLVSLLFDSGNDGTGAFFALNVLMVARAPIAIGRALWRRPTVDVHTVLGAVCIYVLIAMLFAFLDAAIGYVGTESFFVQTNDPSSAEFLYFSFITLTTVGYGDYTAAGGLGRALASIEALLGQIYLVTVVATIVSGMTHSRAERIRATTPSAEEPATDAT